MERTFRILIVDDEADLVKLLHKRLSVSGFEVFSQFDGVGIEEVIARVKPDMLILDVMLPGRDGFKIKSDLNRDPATARLPVLFLTARHTTSDIVEGLRLGVEDYVTKPFEFDELLARIQAALSRLQRYEDAAMIDGLLGIHNKAFFQKEITVFFDIAKRYNKMFSLAVLDINDFKQINDTYGHLAGDAVLKQVSSIMQAVIRKSDLVMRYGGDEFVIIMPETNAAHGAMAVRKIKDTLVSSPVLAVQGENPIAVTLSTGVVQYNGGFSSWEEMFTVADQNLYDEKKTKPNSVTV